MIKMVVLPQKPYKNFDAFLIDAIRHGKLGVEYPCFVCEGYGKVWDPKGYECYEGNKLNTKIPCTKCGGTGSLNREEYQLVYRREMKEWREDYQRQKDKLAHQKSGLKKLTAAEKEALFDFN